MGAEVRQLRDRLYESIRALMRLAQEAGDLRRDLAPGDLPLVLARIGPARWLHGERGGDLSERYLTIVLDGLRAPGATPLPQRPLSKREMASSTPPRRAREDARRLRTDAASSPVRHEIVTGSRWRRPARSGQ